MKNKIIIPAVMLVLVAAMLQLRPINSTRQNSADIDGIVYEVYEAGTKDAVIKLKSNEAVYYINRGLENKLTLTNLKETIVGKKVTISYAHHWTPLNFLNYANRHIGELKAGKNIIYSEF